MNNSLSFKNIGLEDLKKRYTDFDYVIAHLFSDLRFGEPKVVGDLDFNELVELHLFNEKGEIYLYRSDDEYRVLEVTENGENADIEKKYCSEICREYETRDNKNLLIKEYLAPDTDGQAVIVYTRPYKVVS